MRAEDDTASAGGDLEADGTMQNADTKPCKSQMRVTFRRTARKMFGFLSPLAVLAPQTVLERGRKARKDWNMVLIGLSHGLTSLIIVSILHS